MTDEARQERILKRNNELKEEQVKLKEREKLLKEQAQEKFGVSTMSELEDKYSELVEEHRALSNKLEKLLTDLEIQLGIADADR